MVQEQPPRRSKADKKPVTIDLTAEEAPVVAEPVRSNDSDEPAVAADAASRSDESVSEPLAASPAEANPFEPAADTPTDTPTDTRKATDGDAVTETVTTPETAAFGSGQGNGPEPEAPKTEWKPEASSYEPEPTAHTGQTGSFDTTSQAEPRSGHSVPALVASGIFGGIVALLLAGSMQYAGYLPGATRGSDEGNDATSSEIASLRQEIDALKQRPTTDASLAGRIEALEQQPRDSGSSDEMQQRLAALDKQLQDLRSTAETTAAGNTDLTRRLGEAETRLNDRGPEEKMARAVAAAALKAAIDRGGPFEPELQTFANVAGDDPAATQLRDFAKTGVPSRAELQRDVGPAADAMLEAAVQPDPNQSFAARLFSSALSVVKVRQVGHVEGSTPDAVIARIEDSVRNGDLAGAAREWNALPEPAKAAGDTFKRKLDARVQVEDLVNGTLTRAVAGTQG